MCGIIGAALKRGNATGEVYSGLKRLEYRGYDSSGLSVLSEGCIRTVKKSGRVEEIEEQALALSGSIAIGHTRWATHGLPTDKNAHPHVSGKFSLVHNGIIENYAQLKAGLEERGAVFCSDTDSEVIVKLVEANYSGNLFNAVAAAVKALKGSFALAVVCEDFNGIVAVKYKSPAVVGFAEDGIYLCSDVPALPEQVTSVCVPEDGDIVCITCNYAAFYDFNLRQVNRPRNAICLKREAAGKAGYPHFMIKEIYEEVRTVRDTAESFLRIADIKRLKGLIRAADEIIITGCGTAYNAALLAKRFFQEAGKRNVTVEIASELRYFLPKAGPSTLVFAVTQSGETADTVEAAKALCEAGANVIAITNCGYSAITRIAHGVVPVCAGAEICVAATKSYTGQLVALYLLSALGGDVFKAQRQVLDICAGIEKTLTFDCKFVAELCAESSAVFFLGRGVDYAVAVEASLKLKEITYIFSDAYPAGELKHGTLALVDGRTLSIFIITDQLLADKCESAVEQVISRNGKAVVITTLEKVACNLAGVVPVVTLPQCESILSPFLTSAYLQLAAYHTALRLGRDPDKPRNLAKSVTVE